MITGGASGIGRGMARAFADAGMKLMLADLDEAMLADAVAEFEAAGVEVASQSCNVAELAQVEALAEATVARFGAVHVLCNNAGVGIPTPTHKMNLDDWRWIIDVDLGVRSTGSRCSCRSWRLRARATSTPRPRSPAWSPAGSMGAYNVAKHGVAALIASLERDLRGRKSPVHASLLCPGPINTNISRNSVQFRPSRAKPKADGAAEGKAGKGIQAMLEQGMDPDEVGRLVLDAVQRDTFWILTHPNMSKLLTRQVDAMLADQSLTRA